MARSGRTRDEIFMTTHMGRRFHHFRASIEEMNILDVAKALSQNCRFNGHTPFHYSVAQHSLYVDDLLIKMFPDVDTKIRRTALMHDCAETWLPDVHSDVKHELQDYLKLLREIEDKAADCFELIWPEPSKVKLVDGIMLSTELVKLMRTDPHVHKPLLDFEFQELHPKEVELLFLKRWEQLKP